MSELLQYDIGTSSYLFDEEGLMKTAAKSDLTKELEKYLPEESPRVLPARPISTGYIVDVMANVRKIKANVKEEKTFEKLVQNFLSYVQNKAQGGSRIDLVFDSYIEMTIKDSERQKRSRTPAVELNKIERTTPLPIQMETFWSSNKNKARLESLIHQDAMLYPWNECTSNVFVSAFDQSHGENLRCFNLAEGLVAAVPDLDLKIEEADLRVILHAFHAAQTGTKRIVVLSQDTDVLVLCLHSWTGLASYGTEELWVAAGIGDSSRYIPVHILALQLGEPTCSVLPAVHTLTGCDYTSKFGTKSAALKANPVAFLKNFGQLDVNIEDQIKLAEEYLVQVKKKGSSCKKMDELRDFLHHPSKSSELPPTSKETRQHILRAFYATHQMTNGLISGHNIDPLSYGFEEVDDLLMPQKGRNPIPEEFTVKCKCLKCASKQRCSCRSKHIHCCSFCKCRSVSGTTECRNPHH